MNSTRQKLIMLFCLIACFMHAADDKPVQLISCKKWQAHDSAIKHMAAGLQLFTTQNFDKKDVVVWSKEGVEQMAHRLNAQYYDSNFVIDDKKQVICQASDDDDFLLFTLNVEGFPTGDGIYIDDVMKPTALYLRSEGDTAMLYAGYFFGSLARWMIDIKKGSVKELEALKITKGLLGIYALLADDPDSLYIAGDGLRHLVGDCLKKVTDDNVWSLAKDDKHLYAGCANGDINVYEKNTDSLLLCTSLVFHYGLVQSLLFQQNRLYASSKNAVSVWDTKTRKLLGHSQVKDGDINYAPIAVIDNMLYRGLKTGEVIAYDVSCIASQQDKREHQEVT